MQEFSRHHLHFTAETSMPKRKYQGMVRGRLPTQYVLNEMVWPIVFHASQRGFRQRHFYPAMHEAATQGSPTRLW
jgi:hypothetical protein